ncbi:hypothetical protein ABW636_18365 [Aquimarina sp. 2201CG1-2-11]|uniref:hypothetical protein n=1 Tax=Aquimarina discodermiae TaxID=3231043 RepID=UPI0034634220
MKSIQTFSPKTLLTGSILLGILVLVSFFIFSKNTSTNLELIYIVVVLALNGITGIDIVSDFIQEPNNFQKNLGTIALIGINLLLMLLHTFLLITNRFQHYL